MMVAERPQKFRRPRLAVGVGVWMLGGCSLLVDVDGLVDPSHTSDAQEKEAGSKQPDGGEIVNSDGGDLVDGDGAVAASCPGDRGPVGVRVGSFCIDRTEVTRGQYLAFLEAKGSDVSGQPPECAFNTSFVPRADWPPATSEHSLPVNYVDWCDAMMFCRWAGKRLCGAIDGAALPHSEATNPAKSQWMFACTGGGLRAHPYGGEYDASVCNGSSGSLAPVATFAGCEGGFPGVFDMSGNVREWEDACRATTASDAGFECRNRGGDHTGASGEDLSCAGTNNDYIDRSSESIGFRCCAP